MDAKKCLAIFKRFQAHNPSPKTELNYNSSFELLVAVILSAQATDKSVNKATALLFPIANTPEALFSLGEAGLKPFIKTIGLYNNKAKALITMAKILIEKYHSQVPSERADLESLPGVGRKTANVILNSAFHQAAIAVDTHIFRVAHRIGLSQGKTPLAVEKDLLKIVDPIFLKDAHHWLVLHGRYICVARKPRCGACLIRDLCEYPDKTALS